jgi:ABC-type transport system involved in Fe-S cluster assembly fused permease/ATPase subunit
MYIYIYTGFATEALSNIRTVKAFGTEQMERDRFDEALTISLSKGVHYLCLRGWVYVFYVGLLYRIMKPFPSCNLK